MKNKKPVDILISPIPTRGDTIPPNAKPIAPKRAEATPAFLRSQSIAKVLEAVKDIPTIESRQKINISYTQKLQFRKNAAETNMEISSIP